MDPGARRFLWNCVLEMIRGGQSVILTSHSMEECEALCTRLAIMVNGTFKCHGSIQHLKNKFGSGYTLTVRSMGEDSQKLAQFVKDTVLDAELKDSQLNQIQFHLPLKTTKLPHIFNLMEVARTKPELQLEDYSISQMTLDEVFIHFASKQTEEDEAPSNNTHWKSITYKIIISWNLFFVPKEKYCQKSENKVTKLLLSSSFFQKMWNKAIKRNIQFISRNLTSLFSAFVIGTKWAITRYAQFLPRVSRQVFVEANQCHHLLTWQYTCKSKLVLVQFSLVCKRRRWRLHLRCFWYF